MVPVAVLAAQYAPLAAVLVALHPRHAVVAARDREERGLPSESGESLSSLKTGDKPRQGGNTVYVFGYQITEDLLRNAFMPLGKIVNISMEVEKVGTFNPSSQIKYSSFSQVQNESFLTDDLPQNHDIYHDISHT